MSARATVNVVKSGVPGYVNITFRVRPQDALDPMDAGTTELIAVTVERAEFEMQGYRDMGYEVVPEARAMLESVGLL